jgi:copper chaperone CopZ
MGLWTFSEDRPGSGRFLISATGHGLEGANVDITQVRGVQTVLESYSNADPFGDSTAVLKFGGITLMDDPTSIELRRWLRFFSDIDVYWSPSIPADGATAPADRVFDPITNTRSVQNPYAGAIKVWEGFIASMDFSDDGFEVQCQGATFQLDRYQSKPFYPARPWPIEALIAQEFDHTRRPNLRTQPLQVIWPDGWTRTAPPYTDASPAVYAPVIPSGANWTEYVSRSTGSWDASLTSYIQDMLGSMITRPGDGDAVQPGDAWTINSAMGRQPQLYVRARSRPPDFSVWVGTPGVQVQMSGDSTQAGNVIYGQGTDLHGVVWNNNQISVDGTRTDYTPLAADPAVWPYDSNPLLVPGAFVTEVNAKFESGISQADATGLAQIFLARDRDPGWTGSVTLATDPSASLSRWQVRAGMTMVLQGFLGSGVRGVRLHIAEVSVSPEAGTVTLTVDTRYRDLLTVQEAINRTRDPLTPVKMLQVNKQSVQVPDMQAPWDDTAGCGYVPRPSRDFHVARPANLLFPYAAFTKLRPPVYYPEYYVKVTAQASTNEGCWAGPIPIRVSLKGAISRTEFALYDKYGNVLKTRYHVSIYNLDVTTDDMPEGTSALGPDPFIDNAFESVDPSTGQEWPPGSTLGPPQSLIVGWGNRSNTHYNGAGFSPGSEADGGQPTGLLVDALSWNYDKTDNNNLEYDPQAPVGTVSDDALQVWAMFFCQIPAGAAPPSPAPQTVYFMGRLFHQITGSEG